MCWTARVALATTDGRRHSIRSIDPPGGWPSPYLLPERVKRTLRGRREKTQLFTT